MLKDFNHAQISFIFKKCSNVLCFYIRSNYIPMVLDLVASVFCFSICIAILSSPELEPINPCPVNRSGLSHLHFQYYIT